MKKLTILGNERGGVDVMIFSIISLLFCILVMVFCLDYIIFYNTQNKLKNDLNAAVHAGSLSIDETQLAQGYFKLDTFTPGERAQDMFYKYLRLNMNLDNSNKALAGGRIREGTAVNVDELVYVDYEAGTITNLNSRPTTCSYIKTTSRVTCSVTLNAASPTEITRTVDQTVIGPSLVAIIDTVHKGIGSVSDETLLIPAVQEVYFSK
ncbi:hypothetical protein GZH47_31520 (plasmid) [Paenibacillus rhizovicinus]|uniref:Uncharacterized protein n=1 Tax=Paenibacillus rhizovicinus TaxID=2704463 RepID=A0A6C0P9Y6_9BACL|nr:hypothetical protein [Paenibacillus rhizovicinus]QHW35430.1 hypothetical protein GZH47_31520 [Paenibacillus rhizovicinus]